MTCVIALALGINFGIPPFLSFWVEICLFISLSSSFLLGLLPLLLVSFIVLLFCYCLFLQVFSRPSRPCSITSFSPVGYFPGLFFSVLVVFCSSLFIF